VAGKTKSRIPESEAEALFMLGERHPIRWFEKAASLALTAEVIEPSVREFWRRPHLGPNTHASYFMILGYTVEAYLKGFVVRETKKSAPTTHHDLLFLANRAGISVNADERDLLQKLRESIEWIGRYPLAKDFKRQIAHRPPSGGGLAINIVLGEQDIDPAKEFLERLRALV
jgi:hypothetical protein